MCIETALFCHSPYESALLRSLSCRAFSAVPAWDICRDNANCTHWFWCDDPDKCVDSQGVLLPEHACQLKSESRQPWGTPKQGHLVARPSTFASGFVKSASPSHPPPACPASPTEQSGKPLPLMP